jgi:hypothetical protein
VAVLARWLITLTEKLKALTIARQRFQQAKRKNPIQIGIERFGAHDGPAHKDKNLHGLRNGSIGTAVLRSVANGLRISPLVIQRSDNRWNIGNIWPFLLEDHGTWDSA